MGQDTEALFRSRPNEIGGHLVEGLVRDGTPVNAGRLLVVPPMNVGEALGIGGFYYVQQMIRIGRLEHGAHPLPALERVPAEVEDDGDAKA